MRLGRSEKSQGLSITSEWMLPVFILLGEAGGIPQASCIIVQRWIIQFPESLVCLFFLNIIYSTSQLLFMKRELNRAS